MCTVETVIHELISDLLDNVEAQVDTVDEHAKLLLRPALKCGYVFSDPDGLNQLFNELLSDNWTCELKIALIHRISQLLDKSHFNVYFLSKKTEALHTFLELVLTSNQAISECAGKVMEKIVNFSIGQSELRLILKSLLAKNEDGKYCWKWNSSIILNVLSTLPFKMSPDRYFIFLGGRNSGLLVPPLTDIPDKNGFSIVFWIRTDPPNGILYEEETPVIFSFCTTEGLGYICRIVGNCLCLSYRRNKSRSVEICIPKEIKPRQWTFVAIVNEYRRWGQTFVTSYIDGNLIKDTNADFTIESSDRKFERCSIGFSRIDDDDAKAFIGQMSSFSMFSLALSSDTVRAIHRLGCQHKGSFKFLNEAYHLLTPKQRRLTYDGTLTKSIILSYNANCHDKELIMQTASEYNKSYFLHSKHAHMLENTLIVSTDSIYKTLHCLGGIKILLPLFELLNVAQADGSGNLPTCILLIKLFCDLMSNSFAILSQMVTVKGFLVISHFFSLLPSDYINEQVMDLFISICRRISQTVFAYSPGLAVEAIKQLINNLFLNITIEKKASISTKAHVFEYIATELAVFFRNFGKQFCVRMMEIVFDMLEMSRDPNEFCLDDRCCEFLILIAKHVSTLDTSGEEEMDLLLDCVHTSDEGSLSILIDLVGALMFENAKAMIPAFDRANGAKIMVNLMASDDRSIRMKAIRAISIFLKRSRKSRKIESMTTDNLFEIMAKKILCGMPDGLDETTMTMLFQIMMDIPCKEEFKFDQWTVKYYVENPEVIRTISLAIDGSDSDKQIKLAKFFIDHLYKLCQISDDNKRSVLKLSMWQNCIINFLSMSRNPNPDCTALDENIFRLLLELLHYAIRNETNGWRVWVDTCALLHRRMRILETERKKSMPDSNEQDDTTDRTSHLRIGDFRLNKYHFLITGMIFDEIEIEFLESLRMTEDMIECLTNKNDQAFGVNLTHMIFLLADEICNACGGLLPLLGSISSGKLEPTYSDIDITPSDAVRLLFRVANIMDVLLIYDSAALTTVETELSLSPGILMRQMLRVYIMCALVSCAERRFNRFNSNVQNVISQAKYDYSVDIEDALTAELGHSIRNMQRRTTLGNLLRGRIKDPYSMIQEQDMLRLRNIVFREIPDETQAKILSLSLAYFLSVLIASEFQLTINAKEGTEGSRESNATDANASKHINVNDIPVQHSFGESDSQTPSEEQKANGDYVPEKVVGGQPERQDGDGMVVDFKKAVCLIAPLFKDVLTEFSSILQHLLIGSHRQNILNAGLSVLKTNKNVVSLAMLICSQEWQTSLQRNGGFAFSELVNEGRILCANNTQHLSKVAMEADFILYKMSANFCTSVADFDNSIAKMKCKCLDRLRVLRSKLALLLSLDSNQALEIISEVHANSLTEKWMVWSDENRNFYKLDLTEDRNRCRKLMTSNRDGSSHPEAVFCSNDESKKVEEMKDKVNLLLNRNLPERPDSINFQQTSPQHSAKDILFEQSAKMAALKEKGCVTDTFACTLIKPGYMLSGVLFICPSELYFEVDQDDPRAHDADLKWKMSEISMIMARSYLSDNDALEIFLTRGTTLFFVFARSTTIVSVVQLLPIVGVGKSMGIQVSRNASIATPEYLFRHSDVTERWQRREISNFDYLMFLNTIAGRTYQDLNQYPIFPWIISDYTSPKLDLNNPKMFRDLSKPIGALNADRLKIFKERYNNWSDKQIPNFHYGTHYSTAAFVLYWLIRVEPFTSLFLDMQNGMFDYGNRMFHSVAQSWYNCQSETSDVKELIPEFFYFPEMFKNANGYDLGTSHGGEPIGDVILPPWAENADDFVRKNRMALESELVSCQLHRWIDLIFGYQQRGPAAVEANNVFYYLTYQGSVVLDSITDPILRQSIATQIRCFGRTPAQLLREPHPPRSSSIKVTPSIYEPVEEHMCVVLNLQSSSSLVHVSTNCTTSATEKSKSHPGTCIVTISKKFEFACNPYSGESGRLDIMPVRPDPSMSKKSPIRKYLGYSFDHQVPVTNYRFAVSPDNGVIVSTGYWDNSFRLISTVTGKICQVIFGHFDVVTCTAMGIAHMSHFVLTGSEDSTILVWRFNPQRGLIIDKNCPEQDVNPSPYSILTGHNASISAVRLSCSGHGFVVSISTHQNKTRVLQHSLDGTILRIIFDKSHYEVPGEEILIDICPSGMDDIVIAAGKKINMFSLNGTELYDKELENEQISAITFDHGGAFLVVGCRNGLVAVYSSFKLILLKKYPYCDAAITSLAVTENGKHIAAGLSNGRLVLLNVNFNTLIR